MSDVLRSKRELYYSIILLSQRPRKNGCGKWVISQVGDNSPFRKLAPSVRLFSHCAQDLVEMAEGLSEDATAARRDAQRRNDE
jgi:hypothetical protein